jgi:tRNA(Ile)-lysidine synthetase-like protein
MPVLIEYNPRIIDALCRTAETIAAEHDLVGQLLDTAWTGLAQSRPGGVDLDRAVWSGLHPALQRAALRRAYAALRGGETLGLDDVERVRAAAGRAPGRLIELPGNLAVRITQTSLQIGAPPAEDGPQLTTEQLELDVPGSADLGHGWRVAVTVEPPRSGDTRWEAWLSYPLDGALLLRRRRSGERMQQPGGQGSRRIQDRMVDAKLPRGLRDAWPLLVVGDSVVWIPGITALRGAQLGEEAVCVQVLKAIEESNV